MRQRLIKAMGGHCVCCNYDACVRSLDMHHVNQIEKSFSFNKKVTTSWANIVSEARKCVLLCSNCHAEVHCGIRKIPDDAYRFNEEFSEYKRNTIEYKKWPPTTKKCKGLQCGQTLSTKRKFSEFCCDDCKNSRKNRRKNRLKVIKTPKYTQTAICASHNCNHSFIPKPKYDKNSRMTVYCSPACAHMATRKVDRPSKELLLKEISESNYLAVGRKYGVSDNAIRKWLK